MARKLVTEKEENAGTVAKAGLFWAILAAPLVLFRLKRKKHKKRFRF